MSQSAFFVCLLHVAGLIALPALPKHILSPLARLVHQGTHQGCVHCGTDQLCSWTALAQSHNILLSRLLAGTLPVQIFSSCQAASGAWDSQLRLPQAGGVSPRTSNHDRHARASLPYLHVLQASVGDAACRESLPIIKADRLDLSLLRWEAEGGREFENPTCQTSATSPASLESVGFHVIHEAGGDAARGKPLCLDGPERGMGFPTSPGSCGTLEH